MPERKRVAIVEDDVLIAEYLQDLCEDLCAEVVGVATNADEADRMLMRTQPDFVLLDVRLGGVRDGVDVAKGLQAAKVDTKIVFITGSNEPPTISRIMTCRPYKVLIKPIFPSDLGAALQG